MFCFTGTYLEEPIKLFQCDLDGVKQEIGLLQSEEDFLLRYGNNSIVAVNEHGKRKPVLNLNAAIAANSTGKWLQLIPSLDLLDAKVSNLQRANNNRASAMEMKTTKGLSLNARMQRHHGALTTLFDGQSVIIRRDKTPIHEIDGALECASGLIVNEAKLNATVEDVLGLYDEKGVLVKKGVQLRVAFLRECLNDNIR